MPDAGADLGQVERALFVQGLGGEGEGVAHAELLHQLGELGDALTLLHRPHRLDLSRLVGAVIPVDLTRHQFVH